MPPFLRIWRFCEAIIKHWKAVVGGCAIMAILGLLQKIGQPVKWWIYFVVAIVAILVSTFRAWNDQVTIAETATEEKNQQNHQKWVGVIEIISSNIVNIERRTYRFIFQEAYTPNRGVAFADVHKDISAFQSLIETNFPFLPSNVCEMLKRYIDTLSRHVNKMGVYYAVDAQQADFRRERIDASIGALEASEKEIPAIRKELDDAFRKILGVENSNPFHSLRD